MVKALDKESFSEAILAMEKPAVVNFSTAWCPYCKLLAPILEEVAAEHANEIDVYYVDIDDFEEIGDRYDVMTVPSVFVFQNGEVKRSAVNPRNKKAVLDLIFNRADTV